jgi:hypothetical protein
MLANLLLAGFAGVVGALALVALLAAAYIFYKRNKGGKGEGAAGIAASPCRGLRAPAPALGSLPGTQLWCEAPPPTHTRHAAVHTASAYDPGWSPQEMLSDMRAVEAAAEGLVAALSSNPDATGGPRHAAGLAAAACAAPACQLQLRPPAVHTMHPPLATPAAGLAAAALAPLGAAQGIPSSTLQREALKSCLYAWLDSHVWRAPRNWLKVGAGQAGCWLVPLHHAAGCSAGLSSCTCT